MRVGRVSLPPALPPLQCAGCVVCMCVCVLAVSLLCVCVCVCVLAVSLFFLLQEGGRGAFMGVTKNILYFFFVVFHGGRKRAFMGGMKIFVFWFMFVPGEEEVHSWG
jgi:hypothetical protein